MKTALYIVVTLIIMNVTAEHIEAQNLVQNPSFEQYSPCPVNQGQINYATGWDNYGDSPDYFNSCSIVPDFSVPNNWGGYQMASSGNAYSAFGTYVSHIYGVNLREFIGGQLMSPLSVGTKYYVSFKVSLSISNLIQVNCACNHIGAMFSSVPYSWSNPAPTTNNPQIYYDSLITDTLGWTTISGSFTSDSTYQHIIIGNFFDDLNTDTLIMTTDTYCTSYYYLDDVCVSTDSLTCYNFTTGVSKMYSEDSFNVYPNPAKDFIRVDCHNINETYDLRIYNTIGQELYVAKNIQDKNILIDVSKFDTPILLINIRTKEKFFNYKLLKL